MIYANLTKPLGSENNSCDIQNVYKINLWNYSQTITKTFKIKQTDQRQFCKNVILFVITSEEPFVSKQITEAIQHIQLHKM